MGTHGADSTASGPMVTQPIPDVRASVRILTTDPAPPPAAAPKRGDWGSNRRPRGCRSAALPCGHYLHCGEGPPCCFGPHLPLTKNPNCVYLSDCLLAGSGTDWLTVNLSSRCTAEGNRILSLVQRPQIQQANESKMAEQGMQYTEYKAGNYMDQLRRRHRSKNLAQPFKRRGDPPLLAC